MLQKYIRISVHKMTQQPLPPSSRRNVGIILSSMLDEFPQELDIDKFIILKESLEKVHDNIIRSAPEIIHSNYFWNIISDYLNSFVTAQDYSNIQWIKHVIDIFTNQPPSVSQLGSPRESSHIHQCTQNHQRQRT